MAKSNQKQATTSQAQSDAPAKRGKYADNEHLSNPEFMAAGERLLSACKFYYQDHHGYDTTPSKDTLVAMANEVMDRIGMERL